MTIAAVGRHSDVFNAAAVSEVGRTVTRVLTRPEGKRTYHVYVPANLSAIKPGLVVYHHGWEDSCSDLGGGCGSALCAWNDEAEKRGSFLFAYPCGLGGLTVKGSWNSGTCCGPSGGHLGGYSAGPDDLGFVNALIADVVSATGQAIDMSRLYMAGFSNGASYFFSVVAHLARRPLHLASTRAHALASRAPLRTRARAPPRAAGAMLSQVAACGAFTGGAPLTPFRAVAGCAGIVEIEPGEGKGLDACDAAYAARPANATGIAVLDIHGSADPAVPFIGDPVLGFPSVTTNIARWAARLGCKGDAVQTLNVGGGKFTNQLWKQGTCDAMSEVELVTVKGLGHGCTIEDAFSSTAYMASFFERHGL